MKNSFFAITTLLLFIFSACSKDKDQGVPEENLSPIIQTELPASVNSLDPIQFNVHHLVFNGCGRYDRAVTKADGKTITITFLAKYADGFCTMDVPTRVTPYTFVPKEKGTYTFRFRSGHKSEEKYIEQQLEVR
ncbi:hypothetical protein [Pedobacter yulinensis]|nr:hypothetical protein [Pedobacter yulinensis]